MFARLCFGMAAFSAACTAVAVFTIFDLFARYPLPVAAQLFALAAACVCGPLAFVLLRPIMNRFPGGIRLKIHIQ